MIPPGTPSPEHEAWHRLETIPGLVALPCAWQSGMGQYFPTFKSLCLQPATWLAESFPCERNCGCIHRVILRHDRTSAIAACCCPSPDCPDIPLSITDLTPLEVNRARLGRAIGTALGLATKILEISQPHTLQFGAWSPDAIPAILTIHWDSNSFRRTVAELVARLGKPFILFSPTSCHMDAASLELLHHARAAFFPLDSNLTINPDGTLAPTTPPPELFAPVRPQPSTLNHPPAIALPTARQPSTTPRPRYALVKGLGVWHLIFDGQEADIRHGKAIFYVAWLLYNPPEHPIHALDLIAKIPEIYRQQLGLPTIFDHTTGQPVPLERHARLQERSLALDDREALRRLYRKEKELETILDSDASEPEKAEALRELEAIAQFQSQHIRGTQAATQRVARSVRMALKRLHHNLAAALDETGQPHPALRPFATHIQKYILLPSARYSGHGGPNARTGLAGCFTYEPPPGTTWLPCAFH
jgi:hypothetical protein